MDRDTIIWLAGFVDGEGYIGLSKKGKWNSYQLVFSLQTTSKQVMEDIATFLDVPLSIEYRDHPRWKDSYRLRLYDRKAENIIRDLLPFLKVKKEVAELALQYRSTVYKIYHGNQPMVDPSIVNYRNSVYNKMKLLNHRGR